MARQLFSQNEERVMENWDGTQDTLIVLEHDYKNDRVLIEYEDGEFQTMSGSYLQANSVNSYW
jgi:hypothetical protein